MAKSEGKTPEFISISNGPQFTGWTSRIAMWAIMAIATVFVIHLLDREYFITSIAALALALVAPLFLDYQGLQIDLIQNRARHYKAYSSLNGAIGKI